jgi:Ser/Thr protein kinase RdoA (MazF antagonist)
MMIGSAAPLPGMMVDAIAEAYGLVITAPPSRLGGAVNRVFRVGTAGGSLIVRIHRDTVAPLRLSAVHRVQDYLREGGLPVPCVLTTRDGALWVEVDGQLVEVLADMGAGHEVDSWDDAAAVLTELGRFHGTARTIDGGRLPSPVNPCYATPNEALRLLAGGKGTFRTYAGEPGFSEVEAVRAVAEELLHRLRVARRTYADMLPRTLIHGDFVGYNVLLADERVTAILDFDRLAVRERIWDVAYTLMYVLSRLVDEWRAASRNGLGEGELAAVATLLAGYDTASGWPLTEAERRALPFEMARTPLYPIVTAGTDAVGETLRFAPHLPVARWLVDHAEDAAVAFGAPSGELRPRPAIA